MALNPNKLSQPKTTVLYLLHLAATATAATFVPEISYYLFCDI